MRRRFDGGKPAAPPALKLSPTQAKFRETTSAVELTARRSVRLALERIGRPEMPGAGDDDRRTKYPDWVNAVRNAPDWVGESTMSSSVPWIRRNRS